MTLTLSNATNARIADGTATGTINNSDPLQQAWIARFGRTVASEVVAGITDRLATARGGSEVRIAGVTLKRNGATWTEKPIEDGEEPVNTVEGERTMSAHELLMQSAFRLQGESDGPGGASWTAWGRFSSASFEGEADGVELSGDVTTGLLGADVGTDDWIAGVALSAAKGDGPFALTGNKPSSRKSGTVDSALTSVHPYAQVQATDRLALWAIGGYGTGNMTIAQEGDSPMKTDIDMSMAAIGARGTVLDAGAGDALDLAVRTDALWLRTTSEATSQMAKADATVTRLRLIIDASRGFAMGMDGMLTPSIEAGVRRDAGDAEEGTGFEVAAGLSYQGANVSIEGNVRSLVAHSDDAYEEWGSKRKRSHRPRKRRAGHVAHHHPNVGERCKRSRAAVGHRRREQAREQRRVRGRAASRRRARLRTWGAERSRCHHTVRWVHTGRWGTTYSALRPSLERLTERHSDPGGRAGTDRCREPADERGDAARRSALLRPAGRKLRTTGGGGHAERQGGAGAQTAYRRRERRRQGAQQAHRGRSKSERDEPRGEYRAARRGPPPLSTQGPHPQPHASLPSDGAPDPPAGSSDHLRDPAQNRTLRTAAL